MVLPTHFTLNTGAKIPAIGLGTWQAPPGEVAKAVEHALKVGYRHIDAAAVYGNEKEVGEGIRASGVPREEIFITSKVWNTYQDGRVEECLDKTLKDLGVDYLDLYLIHWPVHLKTREDDRDNMFPMNPDGTRSVNWDYDQRKTWAQMERIYKETKKVRAIGLSNFSIKYTQHLEGAWTVIPAVNQVELHPFNPQHELKKWMEDRGILLEAYCPLGSTNSPLLSKPELLKIAEAHKTTPARILISWEVQRGCIVLPKSVTPQRITDNLETIELTDEDMKSLNSFADGGKSFRVNMPAFGSDLGFPDWHGIDGPKK